MYNSIHGVTKHSHLHRKSPLISTQISVWSYQVMRVYVILPLITAASWQRKERLFMINSITRYQLKSYRNYTTVQMILRLQTKTDDDILMASCKTAVSPLLMLWRYCSLALSHRKTFLGHSPQSHAGNTSTNNDLLMFINPSDSASGTFQVNTANNMVVAGLAPRATRRYGIWLYLCMQICNLPAHHIRDNCHFFNSTNE